jgi:uncharacterized protein (TIGR02453 family)
MTGFTGFPAEAVRFYAQLERDNSREFWQAHKATYDDSVRAPMVALLEELADDFGPGTVFRPHRDIRFSRDKSPYKTYQGAFAALSPGTGYYVELSSAGLLAGGGFHAHTPAQVGRYREAVDDEDRGAALEAVVAGLADDGFEVGGDRVATRPRGVPADHPRLELMRHKSLTVSRRFGTPDWLSTPAALDRVRATWVAVRPLNDWLDQHVGPPEE